MKKPSFFSRLTQNLLRKPESAPLTIEEKKNTNTDALVITFSEQMPEFRGGNDAMHLFLKGNLRYPKYALNNNLVGKVVMGFTITAKGNVRRVHVISSPHPCLSKEAIRVIRLMPRWKPGKQNGKPVMVKYTMPINFKLN